MEGRKQARQNCPWSRWQHLLRPVRFRKAGNWQPGSYDQMLGYARALLAHPDRSLRQRALLAIRRYLDGIRLFRPYSYYVEYADIRDCAAATRSRVRRAWCRLWRSNYRELFQRCYHSNMETSRWIPSAYPQRSSRSRKRDPVLRFATRISLRRCCHQALGPGNRSMYQGLCWSQPRASLHPVRRSTHSKRQQWQQDQSMGCRYIFTGINDFDLFKSIFTTLLFVLAETGECTLTCTGKQEKTTVRIQWIGTDITALYPGHTGLVRALHFDQTKIVSGSYDQSIRVWDINTGTCLHHFDGCHSSWVFDVMFDETKIVRYDYSFWRKKRNSYKSFHSTHTQHKSRSKDTHNGFCAWARYHQYHIIHIACCLGFFFFSFYVCIYSNREQNLFFLALPSLVYSCLVSKFAHRNALIDTDDILWNVH